MALFDVFSRKRDTILSAAMKSPPGCPANIDSPRA
jgi:hypothetical protein